MSMLITALCQNALLSSPALKFCSIVFQERGDLEGAIAAYTRALSAAPNFYIVHVSRKSIPVLLVHWQRLTMNCPLQADPGVHLRRSMHFYIMSKL